MRCNYRRRFRRVLGPLPRLAVLAGAVVCRYECARRYPGAYPKGKVISGTERADKHENVTVYHAGTKLDGQDVPLLALSVPFLALSVPFLALSVPLLALSVPLVALSNWRHSEWNHKSLSCLAKAESIRNRRRMQPFNARRTVRAVGGDIS